MDLEKRTAEAKKRELRKRKWSDLFNGDLAPAASLDPAVPAAASFDTAVPAAVSFDPAVPAAASFDPAVPAAASFDTAVSPAIGLKPERFGRRQLAKENAKLNRAGPGPCEKRRQDQGSTKLECAITIFQPSLNFCRFIVVFPTTRVFELG
jgi:hypothetical protein